MKVFKTVSVPVSTAWITAQDPAKDIENVIEQMYKEAEKPFLSTEEKIKSFEEYLDQQSIFVGHEAFNILIGLTSEPKFRTEINQKLTEYILKQQKSSNPEKFYQRFLK